MPHTGFSGRGTGNRIGMTYLQGLTNAENNGETTLNGGLDLAGNEL